MLTLSRRLVGALVVLIAACSSLEPAPEPAPTPTPAKTTTSLPAPAPSPAPAKLPARVAAHHAPIPAAAPAPAPMMRQHAYPIYDEGVVRFKPIAQQGKFGSPQPQGFVQVAEQPVSTFSADVDTASYALTRRLLTSHGLPPPQAVRVEEMINYFPYSYTASGDPATPFKVQTTITPSPWKPSHQLLHIALKGYMPNTERPKLNLVLLIDTSGSMAPIDRLPLLKPAFEQLIEQLRPDDRVAIVSYASDTRVDQEPLSGDQKAQLLGPVDL